jgi:hypothetical protein
MPASIGGLPYFRKLSLRDLECHVLFHGVRQKSNGGRETPHRTLALGRWCVAVYQDAVAAAGWVLSRTGVVRGSKPMNAASAHSTFTPRSDDRGEPYSSSVRSRAPLRRSHHSQLFSPAHRHHHVRGRACHRPHQQDDLDRHASRRRNVMAFSELDVRWGARIGSSVNDHKKFLEQWLPFDRLNATGPAGCDCGLCPCRGARRRRVKHALMA